MECSAVVNGFIYLSLHKLRECDSGIICHKLIINIGLFLYDWILELLSVLTSDCKRGETIM